MLSKGDSRLSVPDERLDLLLACLSFDLPMDRLMALRIALLSEPGALDGMIHAAARRLLTSAALDGLAAKGLLHPARPGKGGADTARTRLAALSDHYADRREALRAGLAEIVVSLNREGIEPLIMKGSVSLLTGEPAWRFQRDIDFAIEPADADRTVAALQAIGFEIDHDDGLPADHHHMQPMRRDWLLVEPHLQLSTGWGRRILPDAPLLAAARSVRFGELGVRLLRDEHALLFGMVHYHFQHHGAVFGVIAAKGLLEYADALRRLDAEAVDGLLRAVDGRPRLAAAVELWTAASQLLLGLTPPPRLVPGPFARQRAAAVAARMLGGTVASRRHALWEEWGGAAAVADTGQGLLRRLRTRSGLLAQTLRDSWENRDFINGPKTLQPVSGILNDV